MEYDIANKNGQKSGWKPAVRAKSFPGFLGLLIMAFGIGNPSKYLPVGYPAGVINKQGICYLASVIQICDAIRFSLGAGSEAMFDAGAGLLGAYKAVHSSGLEFRGLIKWSGG